MDHNRNMGCHTGFTATVLQAFEGINALRKVDFGNTTNFHLSRKSRTIDNNRQQDKRHGSVLAMHLKTPVKDLSHGKF